PARTSLVVSSFFIREQQAGVLRAALGRWQSPLGIEQDGTGVRRKNLRYQRLELFHHGIINFAAFFFGKRFLQRAALIHGPCGDNAAIVGNSLNASQLARRELHITSRYVLKTLNCKPCIRSEMNDVTASVANDLWEVCHTERSEESMYFARRSRGECATASSTASASALPKSLAASR